MGSAPLRLAVVGAGVMGTRHARLVSESDRARLEVVVDPDAGRAERLAGKAGARAATSLAAAAGCQAAVVATPPETHRAVAVQLLAAGVPALVEKPLACDLGDAEAIVVAAERGGVPLTCGFVERFSPVTRAALALLDADPLHVLALRHSPPDERVTIGVVHDLLIHDIDLALRYGGGAVADARGTSWTPPGGRVPELADATLRLAGGMVATLSASRVGQRKVRSFLVTTPAKAIELDLVRQDITVYRHVRQGPPADGGPGYQAETIVDIPFVRGAAEPLGLQLAHFLDLVEGRADAAEERRGLLPPHQVAAQVAAG